MSKLTETIDLLKEVAKEYPGKTIENIIVQLEARRKYDESNDLTTYIVFWEKWWATGGLLFKGSKWLFELPDLYIQAERFDDAEQFVKKIKRTKSDYSEKADYYLKKIEKQKNKKKEGLL